MIFCQKQSSKDSLYHPMDESASILPVTKENTSCTMKLLSGGQSGVDRAVLDVAIGRGIAYGGWCPKGGWAEDLPVPPGLLARYPMLKETPLADPAQGTEWNGRG